MYGCAGLQEGGGVVKRCARFGCGVELMCAGEAPGGLAGRQAGRQAGGQAGGKLLSP